MPYAEALAVILVGASWSYSANVVGRANSAFDHCFKSFVLGCSPLPGSLDTEKLSEGLGQFSNL